MEKKWYQSKTMWSGAVIILVGLMRSFGVEIPTDLIVSIAGGFGLIGIRDALD